MPINKSRPAFSQPTNLSTRSALRRLVLIGTFRRRNYSRLLEKLSDTSRVVLLKVDLVSEIPAALLASEPGGFL